MRKYLKYLLWFAALVPMFMLRDFTPDNELRYLLIGDEAIRDGHFFAFFMDGIPYADKPPLYLWLVMLGKLLWGHHSLLFLSLFSVLPAFVVLLVMDKWASRELGQSWRLPAQAALISTAYFVAGMSVLRMDMLMTMFIVLSFHTSYKIYKGESRPADQWLLPLYVFLALFTKGPYGMMIPLAGICTFLCVQREPRKIARILNLKFWSLLLGLCVLWLGCVYLEGGKDYLHNLLFNQTVGRAVNSFSHKKSLFFYFYSFFYAFAPWCLMYLSAVVLSVTGKHKFSDLEKFFFCVVASSYIMLSLISSKLDIYMLPAYPFVAYLSLLLLQGLPWNRLIAAAASLPALVFVLAFPASLALPHISKDLSVTGDLPALAASLVLLVAGVEAFRSIYKKKNLPRAILVSSCGLYAAVFLASFVIPRMNPTMGYGAISSEAMDAARDAGTSRYLSYKFRRPAGMRVYLGTGVEDLDWDSLTASLPDDGSHVILFLRNKTLAREEGLRELVSGKEMHTVGDNSFVVW